MNEERPGGRSREITGDSDAGLERMAPTLNRCEPGLPNSMTHPWRHEGHVERPDTRPLEDPADISKIMLAKQGHPHTLGTKIRCAAS
jgi:hypothetical protein